MLATVTEFVHEAGEIVLECYARRVPSMEKGHLDIVTEADLAASAHLTERLRKAFPDHDVVCEEHPDSSPRDICWIIDPLDGTKNFTHGHPFFCVSAARLEAGQPRIAITYDPIRRETFTAVLGQGAHLNGEPIHVSGLERLSQAMLTSGFPSGKRHRHLSPQPFLDIAREAQALRRTGSSALDLAYVAAGRFDAVWDWGLETWDLAAGLLLVAEAGGVCLDWRGQPYQLGTPGIAAGNAALLQPLLAHLEKAMEPVVGIEPAAI